MANPPATTEPVVAVGKFLDSPVVGIAYRTATQAGTTNSLGAFNYVAGETVTFFIGDVEFPPVTAAEIVTPLEIAGSADVSNQTVVNIIRLLQTIDADGDPTNGISIGSDVVESFTGVPAIDFSATESAFSRAYNDYLAQINRPVLVDREAAIEHFQGTLDEVASRPDSQDLSDFLASADPVDDCNLASDNNCVALAGNNGDIPQAPTGDIHSGIMNSGRKNGADDIFWGTNVGIRLWSVAGATSYKLYLAPYPAGTPVTVTTINASQFREIDNSLAQFPGDQYYSAMLSDFADGAAYYYAFSAVNAYGESDFADDGRGHFTITAFPAMDEECKYVDSLRPNSSMYGVVDTVRHRFESGTDLGYAYEWLWGVWWPVPEVDGCRYEFDNYATMNSCSAYFEMETELRPILGTPWSYVSAYEENFQTTFYFADGQEYHCSGIASGGEDAVAGNGSMSFSIDNTDYSIDEAYFWEPEAGNPFLVIQNVRLPQEDGPSLALMIDADNFNGAGAYNIGLSTAAIPAWYDASEIFSSVVGTLTPGAMPFNAYPYIVEVSDANYVLQPAGVLTVSSYTPGQQIQGSFQFTAADLDCNPFDKEASCTRYTVSGIFEAVLFDPELHE